MCLLGRFQNGCPYSVAIIPGRGGDEPAAPSGRQSRVPGPYSGTSFRRGNAKFLFEYFRVVGNGVKDLDAKARSVRKDADQAEPKPAE